MCSAFALAVLPVCAQLPHTYFWPYTSDDGLGGQTLNDVFVDRQGYLWSGGYSGLHRFDGYDFVPFPADLTDSLALSHDLVSHLCEDGTGQLWVGTKVGLNRYERRSGTFRRYFAKPDDPQQLPDDDIMTVAPYGPDGLLVATLRGLREYRAATDDFAPVEHLADSLFYCLRTDLPGFRILGGNNFTVTGIDAAGEPVHIPCAGPNRIAGVHALVHFGGQIYAGTSEGLFRLDVAAGRAENVFPADHPLRNAFVKDLSVYQGRLWAATRGLGLFSYDPAGGVRRFLPREDGSNGLLDAHNRALATDPQGNLWIGGFRGLNRYRTSAGLQWYRYPAANPASNQLLMMGLGSAGEFLTYRRLDGLTISPAVGTASQAAPFPLNEYWIDKDLNDIYTDRSGTTWLPRGNDGLYRYRAGRWLPPVGTPAMTQTRLSCIAEDLRQDGIYWLGTEAGLLRYDLAANAARFFLPADFDKTVVTAVAPAADGRVWLAIGGYYGARIAHFDPADGTFTFLPTPPGLDALGSSGRVLQFSWEDETTLWALSSNGLQRIATDAGTSTWFGQREGLPAGVLRSFALDQRGDFWIGTDLFIHRFRPGQGAGLRLPLPPGAHVIDRTALVAPGGQVYFGTFNGLVTFHPDSVGQDLRFAPLVVHEVSANGHRVNLPEERADDHYLALRKGERVLRLNFSALAYDAQGAYRYAYRRAEESDAWQALGTGRSLTISDLPPGVTRLELRSDDGRGNWNPKTLALAIEVPPYWYEIKKVRIGLALFFFLLLLLAGRSILRRRLERQRHEQLLALDEFKSRVFTNLTHEFRTPLTLILGPAKRLRARATELADPTLGREARRIVRQGQRLLALINQVLDLRKLEEGRLEVEPEPTDLDQFLADLSEGFRDEAQQLGITLTYYGAEEGEIGNCWIDQPKVESILTNLLGNALKFTPAGGRVTVSLVHHPGRWSVTVADNGKGIPEAYQEAIFERFGRVPGKEASGTGIGLAVVRELTELLQGKITLESRPGEGTSFQLDFPLHPAGQPARPPAAPPVSEVAAAVEVPAPPHDRPLVLIVEDQAEVAAYLRESLAAQYRTLVASDGAAGLDIAFQEIPDLVVSDVMMPRLNGLQLCARLKADRRTSHLPVLLLTAKSAEEHRLEGLERGADAYLTKPFNERELHLRLRNLLHLRDRAAAHLREQLLVPAARPGPAPAEADWLEEVRQLILARLDDASLGGADLERHLGMSRSQLQRKLQSTLGLSPSRLINQFRLEAAARRLRSSNDPVSDIAYACGFQDPSYFGRKFREHYGVSPKEYREGTAKNN
ncbi:helix-turn-helix domain-containing protein [Lewinella lacunae]|uniref:histidine kinase n=1 Tax=Neolewinella lacunae TaxID=1517758 RepID=A0A923PJY6_9BACT|nr:hybrid sensor histidine kinase/response regulator transcription factor [Neolewinella lacunae]MBC6995462.1 helix-turn-helix domain-containing protein [Neolewinella lacunae]